MINLKAVIFKSNKLLRNTFIQHEIYFIQNRGGHEIGADGWGGGGDYIISAKNCALYANLFFLAFLDQIHLGKCPKGGRGRTELYNYDYLVFIVSATLYSSKPFGYPRVNLAK